MKLRNRCCSKIKEKEIEILTAMTMVVTVFWVVPLCNILGGYLRFGKKYSLHLSTSTLKMQITYKTTRRRNLEDHNRKESRKLDLCVQIKNIKTK